MAPLWIVVLVIGVCLFAFFLTPPSVWIQRVINRFILHPQIEPASVICVQFNGICLQRDEAAKLINFMNEGIFLSSTAIGKQSDLKSNEVSVTTKQMVYQFKLFASDAEVTVLRVRGRKNGIYRLRSKELADYIFHLNRLC